MRPNEAAPVAGYRATLDAHIADATKSGELAALGRFDRAVLDAGDIAGVGGRIRRDIAHVPVGCLYPATWKRSHNATIKACLWKLGKLGLEWAKDEARKRAAT